MHLTPHEQERLLVHVAADVARRRLERRLPDGTPDPVKLNYPEVVALLTATVYEEARAGATVAEVMDFDWSKVGLTRANVMDGVPEMITSVYVEATFRDGTKMVTIEYPLGYPDETASVYPGRLELHPDDVAFNAGPTPVKLRVKNVEKRPIQVGSHFHFADANEGLQFRRDLAKGMRLHIAAGTSERFEPDDDREVWLVPIAGEQTVYGLKAGKSAQEADVS